MWKYFIIVIIELILINYINCENPIIKQNIIQIDYNTNSWLNTNVTWEFIEGKLKFYNINNTFIVIEHENFRDGSDIKDNFESRKVNILVTNNSYQIVNIQRENKYVSYGKGTSASGKFYYKIQNINNELLALTDLIDPTDKELNIKDINNNNLIKTTQTYLEKIKQDRDWRVQYNRKFNLNGTMSVEFLNNNNYLTTSENKYIMLSVLTYHLIANNSIIISYNIYLYIIICLFNRLVY